MAKFCENSGTLRTNLNRGKVVPLMSPNFLLPPISPLFLVIFIFLFFPFLIIGASTTTSTTTEIGFPIEPENGFFLPLGNGNGNNNTILTDDFNSYTDGNLNGQGWWTGSTQFQVQEIIAKEGKAISGTGHASVIIKIGTAQASGKMGCYLRSSVKNDGVSLVFTNPALTDLAVIELGSSGNIRARSTNWFDLLANYEVNTWYYCEAEWSSAQGGKVRFRATKDGDIPGNWSDWKNTRNIGTCDRIRLYRTNANGTGYWDYIAGEPYTPPPELEILIENIETGSEFFVRKTISYGKIIIILLLLIFFIFKITEFLIEIFIPQKLNFKK